jgi:hypothetical protein
VEQDVSVAGTELGFAAGRVPVGSHICQIYSDEEERDTALLNFVCTGLKLREKTACLSEKLNAERLSDAASGHALDLAGLKSTGILQLGKAKENYFQGGCFQPERVLGWLAAFHDGARQEGFAAARVIGEMEPEVMSVPGGERLLEYEARVSLLLRERPVTTMCQYDARAFNGATIMDVLRLHRLMIVRDMVVSNPFFVPPESILSTR